MNPLHLLWILPLTSFVTFLLFCMVSSSKTYDRLAEQCAKCERAIMLKHTEKEGYDERR